MTRPAWLLSRWTIVPGAIAVLVGAWMLYVETHNGGVITGAVVDAKDQPVAGATVLLFERGFVTHEERARTRTDAGGRFRFTGNNSHSVQLEAEADGLGRSERRIVRLWFRAQDTELPEPLRFKEARP
jgi:hypothetical protein